MADQGFFHFVGRKNKERPLAQPLFVDCIPKTTRWASGSKEAAADEEK
jgi:hypothetical protein